MVNVYSVKTFKSPRTIPHNDTCSKFIESLLLKQNITTKTRHNRRTQMISMQPIKYLFAHRMQRLIVEFKMIIALFFFFTLAVQRRPSEIPFFSITPFSFMCKDDFEFFGISSSILYVVMTCLSNEAVVLSWLQGRELSAKCVSRLVCFQRCVARFMFPIFLFILHVLFQMV